MILDDLFFDDYARRAMEQDYLSQPLPLPRRAAEQEPGILSPEMAGLLIFFGFGAALGIGIVGAGIYFLTEVLRG